MQAIPASAPAREQGRTGPSASSHRSVARDATCVLAFACVVLAMAVASSHRSVADVVRLKNGGEIRGRLTHKRGTGKSSPVTITTLTGAQVTVGRDDLEFVTPRSPLVEEYETRARQTPPTIEAHWKLAEWCRENRLRRQRGEQLEQILRIDPNHEAAHRGLGHALHGSQWMTRHEAMLADGYLRHKGRYVTQQELDVLEKTQEQRDAEQRWTDKVRLWLAWANGRHAARRAVGLQKLEAIRDPAAIPALVKFMAENDDSQLRRFFVRLLAEMDGPRPVAPLVHRSLVDSVPAIRSEAVAALRPSQHKLAVALYIAALRDPIRLVVGRAAIALGEMGDSRAVPPLIDALITEHRYQVTYQEQTPTYGLGSDGSIGFAGSRSGLPAHVEALARTGQLPYGAVVLPPPGGTVTKSTVIKRREQNLEVLTALKKLTGQNFRFDQRSWHLWWAANENSSSWGATEP